MNKWMNEALFDVSDTSISNSDIAVECCATTYRIMEYSWYNIELYLTPQHCLSSVCPSVCLSVCPIHRVAKSSLPLNVRSRNATESSKLCEQYSVTERPKNQACTVQYLSPKHGSALPNIWLGSRIPCLAYIQYTFIAKIPGLASNMFTDFSFTLLCIQLQVTDRREATHDAEVYKKGRVIIPH